MYHEVIGVWDVLIMIKSDIIFSIENYSLA